MIIYFNAHAPSPNPLTIVNGRYGQETISKITIQTIIYKQSAMFMEKCGPSLSRTYCIFAKSTNSNF